MPVPVKTLFGLQWAKTLWDAYTPYTPNPLIPIRVNLTRFNQNTADTCVEDTLKDDYRFLGQ